MLRIHTARSAQGVKNYFAQADYYSEGQEVVGQWGGRLAAHLGLSGTVDQKTFDALCDNRTPDGKRLTPRDRDGRRIGEDFTFSLPKDVGAAIMLAPDDVRRELLALAQRRAEQVMKAIENDVQVRVRKGAVNLDRPGEGLLWAGFFHSTARPVPGHAPDPHPHWHMFCFNATRDPVEGRIKAAQMANVFRDRPYYEALFFSLVAKDFRERGHALERRPDGKWGLEGLQPLGERFSKRTHAIEDEAKRLNITDPGRKAELGAKTRGKKQKELTQDELREDWRAQLTPEERDALGAVWEKRVGGAETMTPDAAVAFALDHCSEKQSVMPERELVRVALLHGIGDVDAEQIEEAMTRRGVIRVEVDGRRMVTTKELQAEEDFILRLAVPGRGVIGLGVPEGLTREFGGKRLNDGQWEAVRALLASDNRVNLVEGPAGAGKSSLLAKYAEGVRRHGQDATFLATTSKATEVLQKDGFDANTLARFLVDERLQQEAVRKGGRLVVDETSMLGHKDAHRLFQLVEKLDLKLVCVGDPLQHGAVSRGAFHKLLKDHAWIRPIRLTEILRQKDADYREASRLLSKGETLAGLDGLDAKGWVTEIVDDEKRWAAIASEYVDSVGQGESCLVVSPTHAEGKAITAAIRTKLRASGKLGKKDRIFTRLVAVDATEAQRRQPLTYAGSSGLVVQFHQNAKGFKKGARLAVTEPAAVPLGEAAKFSLYRSEDIALSEGDKVRFTGTVKTKDGQHALRNGTTRVIAGFTERGDLLLDNGWVVSKDAGHFRHAFVETSFGSQGQTHQRVILGMGSVSAAAMNQEQLYVSATRGKDKASLYTDDRDAMRAAVQKSSRKLVALDLRPEAMEAQKRKARLRTEEERIRKLAHQRMRAAWDEPAAGRPMPMPPFPPPGHAGRVRAERERGYER